jgi:hypothetical protein
MKCKLIKNPKKYLKLIKRLKSIKSEWIIEFRELIIEEDIITKNEYGEFFVIKQLIDAPYWSNFDYFCKVKGYINALNKVSKLNKKHNDLKEFRIKNR